VSAAAVGSALEPIRLVADAVSTGLVLLDEEGRVVLANAHVERLFGYGRDELAGREIALLVPHLHDPKPSAGAARELEGRRRDGGAVAVEVGLSSLRIAESRFVLASVADISQRMHGEREREQLFGLLRRLNLELERRVEARTAELSAALREREVLLREVHHRVKNNLQVISSLINLQSRALPRGASREALEHCLAQVQAMALVHEKLYQSTDYGRCPFSEYVSKLAGNIFEAAAGPPDRIALGLEVEDVTLAVDKAIPCGLVLNELITNALKHAFPDGRAGTIRVDVRREPEGGLRLEVSDDGVGLPAGLDAQSCSTLGLVLVRTLARQLDARLEIEGSGGTTFRLSVPGEA
jgi:PAS domain S-box-containing protein